MKLVEREAVLQRLRGQLGEAASRLCRSVRTVDNHPPAVFAKLGVDSRLAAIQAARRAGLALPSRPPSAG